jgi:hypothetical protein
MIYSNSILKFRVADRWIQADVAFECSKVNDVFPKRESRHVVADPLCCHRSRLPYYLPHLLQHLLNVIRKSRYIFVHRRISCRRFHCAFSNREQNRSAGHRQSICGVRVPMGQLLLLPGTCANPTRKCIEVAAIEAAPLDCEVAIRPNQQDRLVVRRECATKLPPGARVGARSTPVAG